MTCATLNHGDRPATVALRHPSGHVVAMCEECAAGGVPERLYPGYEVREA